MRFISKISSYKVAAVHDESELLADGTTKLISKGFMCEFEHGGLTNAEAEFARQAFVWKGLPIATDGTPLDPVRDLHRVGVFDSEWAPEHLREQVEQKLLSRPGFGQDYVLFEQPKAPAPWATYDQLVVRGQRTLDHVVAKITEIVEETGTDPQAVIAYERENLNRGEVIEAMLLLTAGSREPADELVSA